jgi:hypothetical protein
MPIRINLKELFPADSQEITVDKLNFNFNKLLELGIGEEGPIGTAGPIGAIGPIGIQGDQGERGNYWYVDSGNPNLLTFTDLVNGDLYLDSVQLAIWQWDEAGSTWNFVADISLIINNYLSASPSPFRRGLGIGSAEDDRFIIFNRRDDVIDITPGSPAQNDILFLNNFDEDTISNFNFGPANPNIPPQINTDSLFNSLLAIYTNESQIGRFHLNLGTLYDDSGDLKLTNVFQNLKVRYSRETASITPGLTNYTLTSFNLDLPEFSQSPSNRTANGVFGFTTPKLYPASTINESTRTFIGSAYGLDEIVGVSGGIKADGLLYIDETSQIYANLGLALNFTIPTIGTGPANYFMLDGSSTINNILLNKNTIINGNLGIGIQSPVASLHINNGDIRLSGGSERQIAAVNSLRILSDASSGSIILQTSSGYTETTPPGTTSRIVLKGHRSSGILLYTPDTTSNAIIGDINLRPGNLDGPPTTNINVLEKPGHIILERRVQVLNNEREDTIAVGVLVSINSPNTLCWLRATGVGNWQTLNPAVNFSTNNITGEPPSNFKFSARNFDRLVTITMDSQLASNTDHYRFVVNLGSTNWIPLVATDVPIINTEFRVVNCLIPAGCQFGIVVKTTSPPLSSPTGSYGVRFVRFGRQDGGVGGVGP